ncbi:MAG: cation-efflux pump [Anaerolineales bacterium]|jgi:cation diffusion facilitator family transporter
MNSADFPHTDKQADREKQRVALISVLAAVLLTGMKLVVGLLTGSLGILSEAAHSALDLVAAGITLFAVRLSGKPADQDHTYGHGKVENLSALFETFLLLATCVWIVYEAVQRLFFKSVEVDPSLWAFLVMVVSIVVDINRSRALSRVARKYNSQALEADALHFTTDIWSSAVVIGGLVLVRLSDLLNLPWLAIADALAALGVAGIVIVVSLRLGQRTIAALIDQVPPGIRDEVIRAASVPGVLEVKRARVRMAGPETFADLTLAVQSEIDLSQAHEIADRAEASVRKLLPGADVVVHVEPAGSREPSVTGVIRQLAARHGLSAYGIRLYDVAGKRSLELSLVVRDKLTVGDAHEQVMGFEADLYNALPGLHNIVSHIEPMEDRVGDFEIVPADASPVMAALQELARDLSLDCSFHQVEANQEAGELQVSFHCAVPPSTALTQAHLLTERIEQELRSRLPDLGRVVIHVEPQEPPAA